MTLTARSLLALGAAMLAQVPLHAAPVVISDLVEAKAVVELVDMTTRTVLLRDDSGELDSVIASPKVRNLAKVHPGDHVVVSCTDRSRSRSASPVRPRSLAWPKQSPGRLWERNREGSGPRSSMRGSRSRESTLPTGRCPSSDRHGSFVPCRSGTNACSTSCGHSMRATRLM